MHRLERAEKNPIHWHNPSVRYADREKGLGTRKHGPFLKFLQDQRAKEHDVPGMTLSMPEMSSMLCTWTLVLLADFPQ